MSLRPSQVRHMLQDDDMPVSDAPEDSDDGPDAPRQSYNFAPGYHGVVYRAANSGGEAAGDGHDAAESAVTEGAEEEEGEQVKEQGKEQAARYVLQSMKWGLVPSWTRRKPDYGTMLKTINCRDDSLARPGGLWGSVKARKRCVVIAQGFYEWLKPAGGRDKIPHYVRRADGKLMCFAGLWDCARGMESEKGRSGKSDSGGGSGDAPLYTYTIITTSSNEQLRFLHDRMPVILEPGSEGLRTWLDPRRRVWSAELQGLLKPYSGELEVYPVSREVGKVGNDSPALIVPVASKENKSNIANFFANAKGREEEEEEKKACVAEFETKTTKESTPGTEEKETEAVGKTEGIFKREASGSPDEKRPTKKGAIAAAEPSQPPQKAKQTQSRDRNRPNVSATSNVGKSPSKPKGADKGGDGSQKITNFFASK